MSDSGTGDEKGYGSSPGDDRGGGPGSRRLPPFELNGRFLGRARATAPRLQADWTIESAPEHLELILDESGALLPFHFLRTGDLRGRAVVKLLRGDGGAGTGFLVAPGILLTNHHVLPDAASAASATAHANYEAAPPGPSLGRPTSVPLDPEAMFVTNAELDFTFCGVRGLDALGTIPLDRSSLNIAANETVNIIQHPRGRPKEVALRDNRVIKADGVVLHYACSTEPGSSGSPVFNNYWEVVALHHASVVAQGSEGRRPDVSPGDGAIHYLNEGIRISAIAIWLETVEAEHSLGAELAGRLRAIFDGIDPQVGFFGALGRRAHGRETTEVIAESYRDEADDLDFAYWNTRGLQATFRERIADIGRVVADMRVDVWCLAHADGVSVAALREHLDSHYQLDYEFSHESAGGHAPLILLYRRSKALIVERRAWDSDRPDGVGLPPLLIVKHATPRLGAVTFHLVPIVHSSADGMFDSYAESIRRLIRIGQGEADWVVVGDSVVLLDPERLQILAECGGDLLAAASDRDGAMALLAGPRSKVRRVFASSNLRPAFGNSADLTVPRDRELPARLRALGGHLPIVFRLSLDLDPRPEPPANPDSSFSEFLTPADRPGDDDLERRIRDILSPLLSKLLGEMRSGSVRLKGRQGNPSPAFSGDATMEPESCWPFFWENPRCVAPRSSVSPRC